MINSYWLGSLSLNIETGFDEKLLGTEDAWETKLSYVRREFQAWGVAVNGGTGRIYLSPKTRHPCTHPTTFDVLRHSLRFGNFIVNYKNYCFEMMW